jgi:hypothetical protein
MEKGSFRRAHGWAFRDQSSGRYRNCWNGGTLNSGSLTSAGGKALQRALRLRYRAVWGDMLLPFPLAPSFLITGYPSLVERRVKSHLRGPDKLAASLHLRSSRRCTRVLRIREIHPPSRAKGTLAVLACKSAPGLLVIVIGAMVSRHLIHSYPQYEERRARQCVVKVVLAVAAARMVVQQVTKITITSGNNNRPVNRAARERRPDNGWMAAWMDDVLLSRGTSGSGGSLAPWTVQPAGTIRQTKLQRPAGTSQ